LPTSGTSAMNLTWNNNAYYTGTTAGVHGVAHVGTTYTSPPSGPATYAGLYPTGSFVPSSTAGVSNFRSYTSTLLTANANNDNASLASISSVPFVSPTDLHLVTSPIPVVSGAGVTVSVVDDIDGDLRQSPPDIGADEILTYTVAYDANGGTGTQTDPNSPYLV